ncbi:unnamed protein product [Didymodactylos carnosus]|uniref:Uncharacterized protein n=1 Tax=Didymodactylos carnosus TaxID=1234261 RepID=A0A816B0I4_9BILA|nr:unnamed protein product [Didymodactylos carnosus]CAF4481452.1 unnamed protein product [Didymodactylos carnosus]
MAVRECHTCTDTLESIIWFCQTLGLLPYNPITKCSNGHNNWCMGQSSRANGKYKWRCREKDCKLTRSIRDGTFFSGSKLEIQQVLDLMFYWPQGVDTHDLILMTFFDDIANLLV